MKRFKRIYIEITNICNLNCSFCSSASNNPRTMSIAEFAHILKSISPFTDYIYLHVKGEPLLHPELGRLLELSSSVGLKVNITTNGSMIKEKSEILLKNRIRLINFSLHSYIDSANSLDAASCVNGITDFINEGLHSTETIYKLRLWNKQIGQDNPGNKRIITMLETGLGVKIPDETSPDTIGSHKLKDRLYIDYEMPFEWPSMKSTNTDPSGFCYGLRDHIAILADGTVIPCCLDAGGIINLGNIFTENLAEIIGSKRAKSIYNGFNSNRAVEPLCIKCTFKNKFRKSSI